MKVLVTGAGGYVGSVLCDELLRGGFKVKALDNFHRGQCDSLIPFSANSNFEFVFGDVTNSNDLVAATKDIDAVIHLAAIVGFPECAKSPTMSYQTNVIGTEKLIDSLYINSKQHIHMIFASRSKSLQPLGAF